VEGWTVVSGDEFPEVLWSEGHPPGASPAGIGDLETLKKPHGRMTNDGWVTDR
jgi:hypothetical protein